MWAAACRSAFDRRPAALTGRRPGSPRPSASPTSRPGPRCPDAAWRCRWRSPRRRVAPRRAAVVRLRQDGEDSLAVSFFRVDDYTGTIDSAGPAGRRQLSRGGGPRLPDHGGAASSAGRATASSARGSRCRCRRHHRHDADQQLERATFFSFARGNETVAGQDVGHLWNYGINTWGFEDTWGGGDRDYNDMVIGLDFTSAHGPRAG